MLSRTTIEEDLRVYSGSYGADMSYGWPEFEVRSLTGGVVSGVSVVG